MNPVRILLTEDDRASRSVMRVALQLEGHLVAEAKDGAEALRIIAREDAPDVVLLDIAMPVINGFEFLQAVNAMDQRPKTKIIVVTADRTPGIAHELMELGADGFLRKPLDRDDLRHLLATALPDRAGPGGEG